MIEYVLDLLLAAKTFKLGSYSPRKYVNSFDIICCVFHTHSNNEYFLD